MNFDRVARHYRRLETLVFGRRLQAARCAFVRQIAGAHRVLVVGEGNGRFLTQLLRAQPGLEVLCVEASGRMIELARARVGDERVRFVEADIRSIQLPAKTYDLIVTHFFLDCFDAGALPQIIEKLSSAATDDAIWLVADFHEPPRGWRRIWARLLIGLMYLFFRIVAGVEAGKLVDYEPFLEAEGFCLTNEVGSPNDSIRSQYWTRKKELTAEAAED